MGNSVGSSEIKPAATIGIMAVKIKRLIPDSGGSVEAEHGGGGGAQTMELTSSSNSSLL